MNSVNMVDFNEKFINKLSDQLSDIFVIKEMEMDQAQE